MTETALIDTAMDTALATVRGASVLNADDAANLDRLAPELRQTWETAQVFHTRTEMEMSVLNDLHFPTPDSKYWQCVREQNVMFGEMVGLSFEYRKNRVEQLKELRKIEGETDPLARELHQIELDRLRYIGANMERVAKDRMREIQHWHEIKAALLPSVKHGVEDVDAHQRESLPIRAAREAALVNANTPPADARNLLGANLTAQARLKEPLRVVGDAGTALEVAA